MTQPLRKCPENFAESEIDDEIVLMCLTSGDFFSIKDSALAIWNLIDGELDRTALLGRLARDYGVSEDAIRGDVDEFLAAATAAGFVAAD